VWNPISHDRSFFAIARRSRSDPETKYHRKDAKVAKTPFFAPFVVKTFCRLDCFVAPLLAMTGLERFHLVECRSSVADLKFLLF